MSDEKSSSGWMPKVIASVFGAVLAPLLVAIGVKYLGPSSPPPTATIVVDAGKGDTHKEPEAPKPPPPLLAFNGKDLTGFYPYTSAGRGSDPKTIFSVVNGELHVSGEEPGYLATEKVYSDYNLYVEYRWGKRTWPPRESLSRLVSLVVHANGPDDLNQGLVQAFTIRLMEGRTGEIFLPRGSPKDLIKGTAKVDPDKLNLKKNPRAQFLPTGILRPFQPPAVIYQLNHDPDWKDLKGFRAKGEIEKPTGEWNTLAIFSGKPAAGKTLTGFGVALNGTQVNGLGDVTDYRGKVLIRSHGAEIIFRRFEIVSRAPPPKK